MALKGLCDQPFSERWTLWDAFGLVVGRRVYKTVYKAFCHSDGLTVELPVRLLNFGCSTPKRKVRNNRFAVKIQVVSSAPFSPRPLSRDENIKKALQADGLVTETPAEKRPGTSDVLQSNLVSLDSTNDSIGFSTNAATLANPLMIITDTNHTAQSSYRLKRKP